MVLKTFDPKEVSIVIGGRAMTGIADGTHLTVSRNNDSYTLTVGAAGEGARSKSNDKSGTVVLTLLQTSSDNDYLSGLISADELNNSGIVPVAIIDNNGTTVVTAAEAWVRKPADLENADEASNREWTLECAELLMFLGGNS